jgi:hypothetical protein
MPEADVDKLHRHCRSQGISSPGALHQAIEQRANHQEASRRMTVPSLGTVKRIWKGANTSDENLRSVAVTLGCKTVRSLVRARTTPPGAMGGERLEKLMKSRWKGPGLSFVRGEHEVGLPIKVRVDFTASWREKSEGGLRTAIRGKMSIAFRLNGKNEIQRFTFTGWIRDEHFLELRYQNCQGELQFGAVILRLDDEGEQCVCTFAGWGSRNVEVVHGEVDLKRG